MPIIDNSTIMTFTLPGLVHQTVAGPAHGLKTLKSGWRPSPQVPALRCIATTAKRSS